MKKLSPFFFLFLAALFSCRKEDNTLPELTILSPEDGSHYNYGDAIPVHFKASDDRGLVQVSVAIYDDQNRTALTTRNFSYPEVQNAEESFGIAFSDIHLASGHYTLRIIAEDKSNQKVAFREIHLNGVPKVRERLLVMRQTDSFTTRVDSLSVNGNIVAGQVLSGSFSLGITNSWMRRVHISGKAADGITTFVEPELYLMNNITIPYGLGSDLFTDVFLDNSSHEAWFSGNDGYIRAISPYGYISATVAAYHPQQVLITEHYIYSYGENGSIDKRIQVFNKGTGQLLQTLVIDDEVTDLLPLESEDRILVVRNNPGGHHLIPYIRQGNYFDPWTNFNVASSSPILSACMAPGGVIIAHSDGIRQYSFDGNSGNASTIAYQPVSMEYETDDNTILWVLEEGTLHALQPGPGGFNEVGSYPTGGGDKAVMVLYNK